LSDTGTVRVVVKSRRVPVRTALVQTPHFSPAGTFITSTSRRTVVYESVFDEPQLKAIEEARQLSCNLGFEFKVVDQAKASRFGRILSALLGSSPDDGLLQIGSPEQLLISVASCETPFPTSA